MSQKYDYFGKYILLEKLASGGMAEVFLARAPSVGGIGKFVAIKRILPQFSEAQEFIDMFKDEAKIAINLNHSNIVSIHEFGVERAQFFLVMVYVEGRNIRQILNKMKKSAQQFTVDQIVYIVKEVAAGLDHAHRCLDGATGKPLNITHRDMSPQNVMVSFEGEVKIVDFGIAKAESKIDTTRAGTLKGKFGYMSPEQAEGQPVDLRTDIFSLGIILWEMLANDRLFTSNNEINILRKIRDCQIPGLRKINPNIPVELEKIVERALAKSKNTRYQSAADMQKDLNRFLNRHYPDFSSQDFSVFIKTLYSEEIMDLRKRLIEYSKVTPGPAEDKTQSNANPATFRNDVKLPDSLLAEESMKPSDFSNSNIKQNVLDENALQKTLASRTSPPTKGTVTIIKERERTREFGTSVSRTGHTVRLKKVEKSFNWQKTGIVIVAAVGSFVFLSSFFPEEMSPLTALFDNGFPGKNVERPVAAVPAPTAPTKTAPTTPTPAETATSASTTATAIQQQTAAPPAHTTVASVGIVINSMPSGAEIWINGAPTNRTTPSRVEVPGRGPFSLTLKKFGFSDYDRRDLAIETLGGRTLNINLQKTAMGYLNIDVRPPINAKVYVNGRLLASEHLPISGYAVPASNQVVIRAENPATGASDQRTISIAPDQRQSIVLQLKAGRSD